MARTITANSGYVDLTSANPGDNPLSILIGVTVSGPADGVHGDSSQAWSVTNQGTVSGTSLSGVSLSAGGIVINSGIAASITGGKYGVFVSGNAATVTNHGTISAASGAGVDLFAGGKVINSGTAASISGGFYGIYVGGSAAVVTNQGTISATSGFGVALGADGIVTNTGTAARISGWRRGIDAFSGAATIVNAGTISGTVSTGVYLFAGGSVTNNDIAASISGGFYGVAVLGNAATVTNKGSISGSTFDGVLLQAGGMVTNSGTAAHISGGNYGVVAADSATVTNQGTISGKSLSGVRFGAGGRVANTGTAADISGEKYGVVAADSATVINRGTISGTSLAGVFLEAGGIVTNSGSIIGGTDAVQFAPGFAGRLVIDPGAVFSGTVDGGNMIGATVVSTLELASAASAGEVTGLGAAFINFGSIAFDSGADWFIAGDTAGLAGRISGFAFGDTIEVTGIAATGSSYAGGVLTLTEASGSVTLALPGSFVTGDFVVTNGSAGADVTLAAPCFAAGTCIQTERGAVAVEALRVGDRVPVMIGGNFQPIVWLGHRRVDCRRHPEPAEVWPVCLGAGAFGPGRPFRDLWLSPDHAVFIDGVLIPIRYLVNGKTIRQEVRDEVTYWHVELAEHNVLYAEGVPAESYLDTGNRGAFANDGSVTDLHADFARRVWETKSCAPLVLSGPRLAAAKRRLHGRVKAFGHRMTHDAGLKVLVNGSEVFAKRQACALQFRLPEGTEHVRLISRVWIPANMQPDAEDARTLGIAITRLWLDTEEIGLEEACFTQGWQAPEKHWRWTNGDARIATWGSRTLAFEMALSGSYWREEQRGDVRVA